MSATPMIARCDVPACGELATLECACGGCATRGVVLTRRWHACDSHGDAVTRMHRESLNYPGIPEWEVIKPGAGYGVPADLLAALPPTPPVTDTDETGGLTLGRPIAGGGALAFGELNRAPRVFLGPSGGALPLSPRAPVHIVDADLVVDSPEGRALVVRAPLRAAELFDLARALLALARATQAAVARVGSGEPDDGLRTAIDDCEELAERMSRTSGG